MSHYFDTSALVKLVVNESESATLQRWTAGLRSLPHSSDLVRTELIRAVASRRPDLVGSAQELIRSLELQAVTRTTFVTAATLEPRWLRSLDAIHLAGALAMGQDLESIVTYDDRLAEAARHHGIPVSAPA